MPYAVLFPGQGSQFVGMGRELFARRPDLLVETADRILDFSLQEVCLEGPEEVLTRTEYAQPALFALAVAQWNEFAPLVAVGPSVAAGHSLGEYTALTVAGAFHFEDALRLVAERGAAMAAAADAEPSGMAALVGADLETADRVVEANVAQGGKLSVANINAPGQVVVAGGEADLDWLDEHGRDLGARRVIRLKVAGAFHSSFMSSAASRMEEILGPVVIEPLHYPVYSNVTAAPAKEGEIKDLLARQVVAPVKFSETLEMMAADGIDTFVHVGPGDVTAGMAKRTVPDATVHIVSDADQAATVAAALQEGR